MMTDEQMEEQVKKYAGMRERLLPFFEQVADRADWKAPIRAYVRQADQQAVADAIEFFTATTAVFIPTPTPGWLRVEATGYRAGPAGDH